MRPRPTGVTLAVLALASALVAMPAGAARQKKSAPAPAPAPAAVSDSSQVLVRIAGEPITRAQVQQRLDELPESMRGTFSTPEGRQQLLDRIVEERIWLITAVRNGVADRPRVRQQLEQQRRDLLIRTYLNEVMSENPAPPDSEAQVYYDAHKQDYISPATVTVRHIQSRTKAEAQRVLLAAKSGQDWAKLVTAYSTDTLTRSNGGMIGTATHDGTFATIGVQKALAESAFALGEGRIGGPFKTDRGWHVIKVEAVNPEGLRSFDQVRPMILRQLGNQRMQDFYNQRLKALRDSLQVTPDSAAIKRFVSQRKTAHEMFQEAQDAGPPVARVAAYQRLLEQYPDSSVSAQAQFMVGFIYSEELKNYDEAAKAFRELLRRYPDSELAASAQWMVEHMRTEEAPVFMNLEADSSRQAVTPQGAGKGSTGKH